MVARRMGWLMGGWMSGWKGEWMGVWRDGYVSGGMDVERMGG